MSSYLPAVDHASVAAEASGPLAGMVAVRAAEVQFRPGELPGGRGAVLAGAAGVAAGTMMTFCHPVVTAPAVIRNGAVLAGGWLPDFVRLGELERHLGEGVIEALVDKAAAQGRVPAPQRKRVMSVPLTVRLVVAMTLMPDAGYTEAVRRLVGHLAEVPWARRWQIPTSKVVTQWRGKVPPSVLEELFWAAAGPLVGDDAPWAVLGGLPVCAIDGVLVNLADTPANREAFGCSGTHRQHGEGAAPFPQVQAVVVTARAGRATLGAVMGRARAGEQRLLARLIRRRPELFAGRVFCFDRNFPGHGIITAILAAGGHVVARVKDGISLPVTADGWLGDGSRTSYLNAPSGKTGDRLPVRVAEHNAVLPCGDGQQVSETYTLATTLLDHHLISAEQIRDAYLTRWSASETTFGENKTTITGAGDRTTGPVLRSGTPRLAVQEFWAWLTATQLVRASAAASVTGHAAAAHALRQRKPSGPVTTDAVSFTAARHNAVRSMTQTHLTATTTPAALTALAEATSRAALHTLVVTGRQRHSERAQKARHRFPHPSLTKKTVTGLPQITRFAPDST